MSSELQKRLYEMEVTPPQAVWDHLAASLDQIKEDNKLAKQITAIQSAVPADAWENIQAALHGTEKKSGKGKLFLINLKRFAAAAIIAGVAIASWLLLRNTNNKQDEVVQSKVQPVEKINTAVPPQQKNDKLTNENIPSNELLVSLIPKTVSKKTKAVHNLIQAGAAQQEKTETIVLQKDLQGVKSFDKEIDDLSLITSGDNYMTMVNANGRLSKIPAQFAHLAPHLQDKPVTEDYFEVLFGEGNYWKETMSEWRKKLAAAPVSSGDAFTSFIELLKTVQQK